MKITVHLFDSDRRELAEVLADFPTPEPEVVVWHKRTFVRWRLSALYALAYMEVQPFTLEREEKGSNQ